MNNSTLVRPGQTPPQLSSRQIEKLPYLARFRKQLRRPLSSRARLLGMMLAEHGNRQGLCRPSIKTLTEECGWTSTTTTHRAMAELIEAGNVVQISKGRSGRASLYRLTWPGQGEQVSDEALEPNDHHSGHSESPMTTTVVIETPPNDHHSGHQETVLKRQSSSEPLSEPTPAVTPDELDDEISKHRTRKAKAAGTIHTTEHGYRARTLTNLRLDERDQVLEFLRAHPDDTDVVELAGEYEQARTAPTISQRRTPGRDDIERNQYAGCLLAGRYDDAAEMKRLNPDGFFAKQDAAYAERRAMAVAS